MKFGPVPVDEAEGAILAHTHRASGQVWKKGHVLTAGDLAAFRSAGLATLTVARPERGDVPEDEAATRVAEAARGEGVRAEVAKTGRVNLYAEASGLLLLDRTALDSLNLVDESITIATLSPFAAVSAGEMVATVKVIPFAVPEDTLDKAVATLGGPSVELAPFRPCRAGLILTRLPAVKEVLLDRGAEAQRERVRSFGGELVAELRCDHDPDALAAAIRDLVERGCDPILCLGASAIVDRRDVVPAAVETLGGQIDHFGMPMDPGNLLLLGRVEGRTVVGVPGCARSLKPSGFDRVLARVLAGLRPDSIDVMRMGVGGLLHEVHARPSPRQGRRESEDGEPKVAGVLLAAGRSTRMGAANKLLQEVGGEPIVRRAARTLTAAGLDPVVVVVGHEEAAVREALADLRGVTVTPNADFAQGMGTSLAAGIEALADAPVDAAVVALGDMPWVRPEQVRRLVDAYDVPTSKLIAVPVHGEKRGHPVLWSARFFPELARLGGDRGARDLLATYAEHVKAVPIDDAAIHIDIDTPDDLAEARSAVD